MSARSTGPVRTGGARAAPDAVGGDDRRSGRSGLGPIINLHCKGARVLAVAQRPLAGGAFAEAASTAAWRAKPSWAIVAGADQAINPEVGRFGAERAGATVVEVAGASHAVAVSRPEEVAGVIREAVRAVSA
ncbi:MULTISPECIES: alpha/beta fold hydrolase [unclassified Nonomuraea]|uniref:alpha/beta fold hydrolase n=1 Tax=unclassified Nonomuraea TaxID=2593643 RepID=UPI0033EB93B6